MKLIKTIENVDFDKSYDIGNKIIYNGKTYIACEYENCTNCPFIDYDMGKCIKMCDTNDIQFKEYEDN